MGDRGRDDQNVKSRQYGNRSAVDRRFYPRSKAHLGPKPPKAWKEPAKKKARGYGAVRPDGMCQHCTKKMCNRPRGLCWTCYYDDGVKALYPSTSKYAKRGVGNFAGEAPLAAEPTTAAPGTAEKMKVMSGRAKAGKAIFHPADARFEGDLLPVVFLKELQGRANSGLVNERCAA